jgi:hypothetical protein
LTQIKLQVATSGALSRQRDSGSSENAIGIATVAIEVARSLSIDMNQKCVAPICFNKSGNRSGENHSSATDTGVLPSRRL